MIIDLLKVNLALSGVLWKTEGIKFDDTSTEILTMPTSPNFGQKRRFGKQFFRGLLADM